MSLRKLFARIARPSTHFFKSPVLTSSNAAFSSTNKLVPLNIKSECKELNKGDAVIGLLSQYPIDDKYLTMFPIGTYHSEEKMKTVEAWMKINRSGLGLFKLTKKTQVNQTECPVTADEKTTQMIFLDVPHDALYPYKELFVAINR